MENPKVSIVIPVYNGSNYLREAIDSALGQSYKNIEIIVINDGSNDGGKTEKIALSYGNKIRYYKKNNGGVASALNMAITLMEGDYFSWLSHDDIYFKNKIQIQINELSKVDDKTIIVISDYELLHENTRTKRKSGISERYELEKLCDGTFLAWNRLIHGCTVLIHKSIFEKKGMFDESLITTQDYDMWFRILINKNVIFINKALIFSRVHNEQGSKTIKSHSDEQDLLYCNLLKKYNWRDGYYSHEQEIKLRMEIYSFLIINHFEKSLELCREQLIESRDEIEDYSAEDNRKKLFNLFSKLADKLYIWGMGTNGKRLYYELMCRGIKIDYFIDSDPKKRGCIWGKTECKSIDDIELNNAAIIVTPLDNQQIIKELNKNEFNNYIDMSCERTLQEMNLDFNFMLDGAKEIL